LTVIVKHYFWRVLIRVPSSFIYFISSTHYAVRGGDSLLSAYCGAFLVDAGDTASYAYWIAGAALL